MDLAAGLYPWWKRLRLRFVRSQIAVDFAYGPECWIRYKVLNGVTYLLDWKRGWLER